MKNSDCISRMVEKLVAEYKPEKIILFGSYAWGEPDRDSDIDLFIVKKTDKRFIDRWSEVHRILTGLHSRIPLDTIIYTPKELEKRIAIGDQFIASIIDTGKVLYATEKKLIS